MVKHSGLLYRRFGAPRMLSPIPFRTKRSAQRVPKAVQTDEIKTIPEHSAYHLTEINDNISNFLVPVINTTHVEHKDRDAQEDLALDRDKEKHEFLVDLNKRIMACAQSGRFEAAEQGALFMLQYASSSPEAYIRLAEVHMMEGKASKALNIYETAITTLPELDDNFTAQLLAGKEVAAIQANTKIDPVEKFSAEILDLILGHLGFNERIVYLDVSRTWMNVLAQIQTLWLTMKIENGWERMRHSYRLVMHHVIDLKILGVSTNILTERIMCVSPQWPSFRNLSSLTLRGCYFKPQTFVAMAIRSASCLKELTIEKNHYPFISILDVLSLCPNLIRLRYRNPGASVNIGMSCSDLPDKLCLEELTILHILHFQEDIDEIIRRSPNMRELSLVNARSSTFQLVSLHCPDIIILSVDYKNLSMRRRHQRDRQPQAIQGEGLQILEVGVTRMVKSPGMHESIPFITNQNRQTLKSLSLDFQSSMPLSPPFTIADVSYGGQYSNLSMLCLHLNHPQATRLTVSLLAICPMLSAVEFVKCDLFQSSDVFNALLRLEHLTRIGFARVKFHPLCLEQFIMSCVNNGTRSPVTMIKIILATRFTMNVLWHLTALKSLQVLRLEGLSDLIGEDFSKAIVALTRLPDLRELWIGTLSGFMRDFAVLDGQFMALKELTIGSLWFDPVATVGADPILILSKVPNLETCTFLNCSDMTESIAKQLGRLMKVNCVSRTERR